MKEVKGRKWLMRSSYNQTFLDLCELKDSLLIVATLIVTMTMLLETK